MDLAKLCAAAGLRAPPGANRLSVTDVVQRAADARPDSLFVCVRGARSDGHDHAGEAVSRGAVALVVERPLPEIRAPQVVAESTRAAMGPLAAAFFGHPTDSLRVAGVTGTNGKTTTAFVLAEILEAAGLPCGLLGTVRRRVAGVDIGLGLTTPEAIDLQRAFRGMLDGGDEACAMEVSSIALAQGRLEGTRFAAVGFTNLSRDHLDFHGTMEEYFAAKAQLFDGRAPRATNADDPWGRRLPAELSFAIDAAADVKAERIALSAAGLTASIQTPRFNITLESSLRGRFNLENILCAVALALLMDVEGEAIAEGVARAAPPRGRFDVLTGSQPFAVVVDYAHTPAALETVLASARTLGSGRVICVVGAGGDRDRDKRPLMGAAAERASDRLYITSDNPRSEDPASIIAAIVSGLAVPARAVVEPDRRAAIVRAIGDASAGDVVVICGKGHEQGQEIGAVVHPFDDRDVARSALGHAR